MKNIEAGQQGPRQIDPHEVLRLDGSAQTVVLGGDGSGHSIMDVPGDMIGSLGTIDLGGKKADVMARLDMGSVTHFALVDTRPGEPFGEDGLPPDDRYALLRVGDTSQNFKPMITQDGSYVMAFMHEPDTTHFIGRQPEKVSSDIQNLAATHDPYVSRKHVGIAINEDGGFKILDVSSQGTRVTVKTTAEQMSQPEELPADPEEVEEIGEVAVEEVVDVEPVATGVAPVVLPELAPEAEAEPVEAKEDLELPAPVVQPPSTDLLEDAEQPSTVDEGGEVGQVESKEEQISQNKQQAMQELRDEWGMPEDFTEEQAVERLTQEHNELELIIKQLIRFGQTGRSATKAIYDTFGPENRGGIVYLGNRTKGDVDHFLLGRDSKQIDVFPALDSSTLLPRRLREMIAQKQTDLNGLRSAWQQATNGFRSGRPSLERDSAHTAAMYLSRSLPELERVLVNVDKRIKQQVEHITGRPFGAEEVEAIREEVVYRNPEWAKRAEKLKDASVDDPELEALVTEIRNYVRIESGMVDDPNSPRKWFGDQVLEDTQKQRQDLPTSGRPPGNADSQRVVAEIAADMLRGKFNYDRARSDSIDLSSDGKTVIRGQHRAAALAMIFGDRWIEEAKKKGMQIARLRT